MGERLDIAWCSMSSFVCATHPALPRPALITLPRACAQLSRPRPAQSSPGVCGKTPETAVLQDLLTYSLKGLVRPAVAYMPGRCGRAAAWEARRDTSAPWRLTQQKSACIHAHAGLLDVVTLLPCPSCCPLLSTQACWAHFADKHGVLGVRTKKSLFWVISAGTVEIPEQRACALPHVPISCPV